MLLETLSVQLGLNKSYLHGLALAASHHYKKYAIPKRNSSGFRTIYHPSRRLKLVQRWLVTHIVQKFPVHDAAVGYRKGIGISKNATIHAPKKFLLRLDLQNFFESIKHRDIESFLLNNTHLPPGWVEIDTRSFTNFVCCAGKLVIGAPSSPSISNAILFEFDSTLAKESLKRDIAYTRYADDMFFSTNRSHLLSDIPDLVSSILSRLPVPVGLTLNPSKTRHSSSKTRKRATGLILTPRGRPSLGRVRKRQLSARVHQFRKLAPSEAAKLAGWLAFAKDVEPEFVNRLCLKYGAARVNEALKPRSDS